ncbi:MAG: TetR family transcriptional regulator [Gemmatimonadales bacterium]|nr:TetR family transcriptional regulator [Gemmatimonadales bacterium]
MVYRTTPRMERRKAKRRRRFMDVATRLFAEGGYHETTVPMVVAESGSSTGSFYFYFANKEELFVQLLLEIGERVAAQLNEAIAGESEPLAQMRAAVERLFLFLAANPAEARILILEATTLGGRIASTQGEILASHARSVESALRTLSEGPPTGDPAVVAHCWVGAVYHAVRYWLGLPAGKRPPAATVAGEVARFNLRGIGHPPGGKPVEGPTRER